MRYPRPDRASERRDRFEAVYTVNFTPILGYAMRRTVNGDDAADVVAETEDDMPKSRSRLSNALTSGAAGLARKRWLARAPVWLFRARLGFVFGSRLLLLEHTGRNTGARRYAVLEVVGRPRPGTYVVPSGLGARAQWYRNIQANPSVRVYVGIRNRVAATARLLPVDEAKAVLDGYEERHALAWAVLSPVVEKWAGAPLADAPMIALELRQRA